MKSWPFSPFSKVQLGGGNHPSEDVCVRVNKVVVFKEIDKSNKSQKAQIV